MQTPFKPIEFLSRDVRVEKRDDGTILLQSNHALKPYERHVPAFLAKWAATAPDRVWLAQRRGPDREWLKVTYAEAKRQVDAVTQALLDRGFGPDKPVMILSSNSIEFALLSMAAMQARAPLAPVSPAYSVMSQDHAKLRYVFDLIKPGLVFVQNGEIYARALAALDLAILTRGACCWCMSTSRRPRCSRCPGASFWPPRRPTRWRDRSSRSSPGPLAKFLFTSGSTGMPKAVINTQEMMCANLAMGQMARTRRPDDPSPVQLDWLPWNHTMGGNATFQGNLAEGGTTYIDDGKPLPGLFEETLRNLREISPTYLRQRAGGLRHAGDGAGEGGVARQALLQEPEFAGLWRRHAAVRPLRAHGDAGGEAHRLPAALRHRLGLDRDGADRDHRALGVGAGRPDRPAISRRAAETRADRRGRALRAAPQERDRDAGLPPSARSHGRDVRRGGFLQDRRCRPLRRSRRTRAGA